MKNGVITGVIAGVVLFIGVVGINDSIEKFQRAEVINKENQIATMIDDIFAPKTIEQFDNSRNRFEGKLISEEVAQRLYTKYSNELNENDLKRSTKVSVNRTDINFLGESCFIADVYLCRDGVEERHIRYRFTEDSNGIITDYFLEVL